MPVLPTFLSRSISSTTDTRALELRAPLLQNLPNAVSKLLFHRTPNNLQSRQTGVYLIPIQYQDLNSRSPGIVALIVLGSVAGFLLLIWLLWIASNGTGFIQTSGFVEDEVVVVQTPRSQRSRRTEMVSRSPPRRVIRTERIVRENTAPPPPRSRSRMRETIVVEEDMPPPLNRERRVPGDDIIEVMEEHSSIGTPIPARRESRRQSRRGSATYRSVEREPY